MHSNSFLKKTFSVKCCCVIAKIYRSGVLCIIETTSLDFKNVFVMVNTT